VYRVLGICKRQKYFINTEPSKWFSTAHPSSLNMTCTSICCRLSRMSG